MEYLTYTEYQGYGGTLSSADFTLAEFKARKYLDELTDCRIAGMSVIPDEVKMCMMSVINIDSTLSVEAQAKKPVVKSFTNDGYSETYESSFSQNAAEKAIAHTVNRMLWGVSDDYGVPLLYRGVTPCMKHRAR